MLKKYILTGGTDYGSGDTRTDGAIQRTLVYGAYPGVGKAEAGGCLVNNFLDLFAEKLGHGAVQLDIETGSFRRENLNHNVAGLKRTRNCIVYVHGIYVFCAWKREFLRRKYRHII